MHIFRTIKASSGEIQYKYMDKYILLNCSLISLLEHYQEVDD